MATRRIIPLTGQVLIEVIAPDNKSPGGVDLPDERPLSPEFVESTHKDPRKPAKHHIGIVRAIGEWPKLKCGLRMMPEYGIGNRVVFNPYRGIQLKIGRGDRLKLINQSDVLAVLKESV